MKLIPDHWTHDISHATTTATPLGTNDRIGLTFDLNLPLRCQLCDCLMDQGELDFQRCPSCNGPFTKKQAIDMYVEAVQVSAHGGWGPAIMDQIRDKRRWDPRQRCSYVVNPHTGKLTPVTSVHRRITEHSHAIQRQELAQSRATQGVLDHLRENSINYPVTEGPAGGPRRVV